MRTGLKLICISIAISPNIIIALCNPQEEPDGIFLIKDPAIYFNNILYNNYKPKSTVSNRRRDYEWQSEYGDYPKKIKFPFKKSELYCLAKVGGLGIKGLQLIGLKGIHVLVIAKLVGYILALLCLLPYVLVSRPIIQIFLPPVNNYTTTTTTTQRPTEATRPTTTPTTTTSTTTPTPITITTPTTPFPIFDTCPPCFKTTPANCRSNPENEPQSTLSYSEAVLMSLIQKENCIEKLFCKARLKVEGLYTEEYRVAVKRKISKFISRILKHSLQYPESDISSRIVLQGLEKVDSTNCRIYNCQYYMKIETLLETF